LSIAGNRLPIFTQSLSWWISSAKIRNSIVKIKEAIAYLKEKEASDLMFKMIGLGKTTFNNVTLTCDGDIVSGVTKATFTSTEKQCTLPVWSGDIGKAKGKIFLHTGEMRVPKRGEWFVGYDNTITLHTLNSEFNEERQILKAVDIKENRMKLCTLPVFDVDIEKAKGKIFFYTSKTRVPKINEWFVSSGKIMLNNFQCTVTFPEQQILKAVDEAKKVALIGSSQYTEKFKEVFDRLTAQGHIVRMPALDDRPELDELGIMEHNRELIEWADEVHVIWDARSIMTIGDWCMAYALRKPIFIAYMEPKRIHNFMMKYHDLSTEAKEMDNE